MDKAGEISVRVLAVGLDPSTLDIVGAGPGVEGLEVESVPADVEKLMESPAEAHAFVLCGSPPEGVSVVEVAQVLRMQYAQVPIYFVAPTGSRFDRKDLVKNGFTDVFFLPLDRDSARNTIADQIVRIRKRGRLYRPVKLVDIQPDSVLDFDTYVYFPVNDKHVCYSTAGSAMEKERVDRLRKHKMSSLFVGEDELPRFYAYTAKTLKALGEDGKMSDTERSERLHSSVRDLISGLFTDSATGTDGGKKIVEDCQKIVKNYVTDGPNGNWYARLLSATGGNTDTYSHAADVSTYAALFGIALGLKTIEDLALAGLLHDIGLAKVPAEISAKDPSEWNEAEKREYEKHPGYSIEMIQDRKLVVSDLVHRIILQHHEAFNGTGYPKALAGKRICPEAQVLALADRFADLTAMRPGHARKTPIEAISELHALMSDDPSRAFVEPAMLKRVLALFPAPETPELAARSGAA